MLIVYLFLGAGAFLALLRVFMVVRRQRLLRNDDWDAQLVRNFRAQGGQGFQPVDIDFFFGVPQASQCEPLAELLRGDSAVVDWRAATSEGATGYTLHARKPLRVSLDTMHEHSRRYREWAARQGASYDGWAAEGVTPATPAPDTTRLRPRTLGGR
jgi:hypothetical protein